MRVCVCACVCVCMHACMLYPSFFWRLQRLLELKCTHQENVTENGKMTSFLRVSFLRVAVLMSRTMKVNVIVTCEKGHSSI